MSETCEAFRVLARESEMGAMTDEELDRQALEAGGADNDPDTPE